MLLLTLISRLTWTQKGDSFSAGLSGAGAPRVTRKWHGNLYIAAEGGGQPYAYNSDHDSSALQFEQSSFNVYAINRVRVLKCSLK